MKLKVGLYTPTQAAQMNALISQYTANQPRQQMQTPSKTQIEQNGGVDYSSMNLNQLEELWNSDPSGKKSGAPLYDWAAWMRDPQGKIAGVSFDSYQRTKGPVLKAK